jgi:hypothetical protein
VGTTGQETAGAVARRERYFLTEAQDFGHGNDVINISCVQPNNDAMGEMISIQRRNPVHSARVGRGLAPWRTYDQRPLAACLSFVDGRGNPSQSEQSDMSPCGLLDRA